MEWPEMLNRGVRRKLGYAVFNLAHTVRAENSMPKI